MNATQPPSGTVTFLFTDVESSTRIWQDHPDAMTQALTRHDEIVRHAIEAHHGYVVKTTGDGVHAAFTAPRDAVDAAIETQLALARQSWPLPEELRIRIGIHTGPAEQRDGDYYGTTLNRAVRLTSTAHGGQIVVSLATEELVRDSDVELIDLGEHALRDLARPEHVFQVAHPELRRDFPRLASLDAFGGNLPIQVTSFIGRDDEVTRVTSLLDGAPLVTLIGTGGVGKTRLSVQCAAEVLPRFADGAWFCELAAVDEGEAMAQVIAATLGCLQRPAMSLAQSIVEYVKVRELLLVLDNCEHLLDDAAAFADAVLRSCPKVTLLATSREPLDVNGERVVRVRSLDAPSRLSTPDEVVASAAVRLFADRAADAGGEPTWDEAQCRAVGEICRRLDGIPLAIELAAARTVAMHPVEIATHLDERFRLLTGKRRGRVERHQTLRATVDWSYQLLGDDERTVFNRLGVFPASFDGAAAAAVASDVDIGSWEIADTLASLVAKSMLATETGPGGTTRYAMNETLRQFAREHLDETDDNDDTRRKHAAHLASWARLAADGLTSAEDLLWVALMRVEIDNVRAAVGWALDRDEDDDQMIALRILAPLSVGGRAYSETGLDTLAAQAVPIAEGAPPKLRAPVLALAAMHHWGQGRIEEARALGAASLRDGVVSTDTEAFEPYGAAMSAEMLAGNHERGLEIGTSALAAVDGIDNPHATCHTCAGLAIYQGMSGRFAEARANADRALEIARRIGSHYQIAFAHHATAWAYQHDDLDRALAAVEECVAFYRQSPWDRATPSVLALAGGLRARTGDDGGALALFGEAVRGGRDQGARPQLAAALDWSLSPLIRTGRPDIAATFLGALTAGPLANVGKYPGVEAERTRGHARIARDLGDDKTNQLTARGAAMTYDELVDFAIGALSGEDPKILEP
jgi:predicted ATPase/class 3 adenylate cyclase